MIHTSVKNYLNLVKFSHAIFALPFACIGFALAYVQTNILFEWRSLALMLACMVFARNTAMSFNRYADRRFDALNKRTANREIPRGIISPRQAIVFCVVNMILFVLTTALLNILCLLLSPVALLVIIGYSITKRFTWACHLILGLSLAIAPTAAFITVAGTFAVAPMLFSSIVLFWVSGFDIIYSLHDEEFDRQKQLFSIPARFGCKKALAFSSTLHVITAILVIITGITLHAGILYIAGSALFCGLLMYQHFIVKPADLSHVNAAFATTNGIASVIFSMFIIMDLLKFV